LGDEVEEGKKIKEKKSRNQTEKETQS